MENWPRIPREQGGSPPSRSGGNSLPPPGSVIIAGVEEELGEGMYALRWAGNRIAVSSRVVLSPGQSLILKSEISPEGKPTLVVQGPALPEASASVSGGTIYGRGGGRAILDKPDTPVWEDDPSRAGREAAARPRWGEVAAGAVRGSAGMSLPALDSWIGLVLEPLEDFSVSAARLLAEAEREMGTLKNPAMLLGGKDSPPVDSGRLHSFPITELGGKEGPPPYSDPVSGNIEVLDPIAPPQAAPGSFDETSQFTGPVSTVVDDLSYSGGNAFPRPPTYDSEAASETAPPPPESQPAGENVSLPADSGRLPSFPMTELGGKEGPPPYSDPVSGNIETLDLIAPRQAAPGSSYTTSQVTEPGFTVSNDLSYSGGNAFPRPPTYDYEAVSETALPPPESRSTGENVSLPADSGRLPSFPMPELGGKEGPLSYSESAREGSITPQPSSERPPPDIQPEVFVKDALEQLLKMVGLPLVSPSATGQSLGAGGKMPEAVVEKAAGILLRAAGLTPDYAALEAAKILVDSGVQVERQTVQAMIALAAGTEAEDRAGILKAAARLAAHDIPLAVPLVEGFAGVMGRKSGIHELMERVATALAEPPELPEAGLLLRAAREILDLLHVDLESADAGPAIERYVSTFGREALGKTLALVEKAAQAVLENHPLLPRMDQALAAILRLMEKNLADAGGNPSAAPAAETSVVPGRIPDLESPSVKAGALPTKSETTPESSQAPAESDRRPATENAAFSPINAYLKAPRAFPGLAALDLPPMPKVVRLPPPGTAPDQTPAESVPGSGVIPPDRDKAAMSAAKTPPAPAAEDGQPPVRQAFDPVAGKPPRAADPPIRQEAVPHMPGGPNALIDGGGTKTSAGVLPSLRRDASEGGAVGSGRPPPELEGRASFSAKLDAVFSLPGLNRPEFEWLRQGNLLGGFFASPVSRPGGGGEQTVGSEMGGKPDRLVEDILSEDSGKRERAWLDLARRDPETLREIARNIARMEREILRAEPLLNRLAEASSSLRELGRQLLAVKAENLSGQNREPGVMLAEVPFKLADDAGDGRMQMFYRRANRKADGWTSRVILDLN
ncbi:MAG: hypothetical protein FWG74_06175, partial [Planctomycetes bacterium]|nr:hypothetical protein [Planctomycetota bacterium]